MKKPIIVTIALLTTLNVTAQTNYYVDKTTGNDLNNGTSLATAWKTIQKACSGATPNSIVQIKAGTYNENIIVNVSGTEGNPITFRNYMNDVVVIDGVGTSGTTMLTLTNKNYLSFQNLTIQNLTVNNAQGILVETTGSNTSTALSFKNITIKNINWTNDPLTIPTSNDNAQGYIAYGGDGGITNITIDSCEVYNCILGYSEAMTLDGNINGFIIKNCQIHDNTNIGIDIAGNYAVSSNPTTDCARNGVVSNNTCYKNVSLVATSAGVYVDGGKNVIIEKNKCYENGWGIEVGCEENGTADSIIVKNNIIFNNKQGGMAVGGYTTVTTGQVLNTIIRNNTFFQNNSINDGTGELFITKASNCAFENNVFYTNSQNVLMNVVSISPQTNNTLDYNCWYTPSANPNSITVNWNTSTYTSFSSYQAGAAQEGNSIYSNPLLTNPALPTPILHLLAASPCINTGKPTTVIGGGETDYDGNVRLIAGIIDIGAYEFNSAVGINKDESKQVSTHFTLSQNFPNPFNPSTVIRFALPKEEDVRIDIYNMLGQKVEELINERLSAGFKQVTWRAKVPSGVYLYRMTVSTGDGQRYEQARRMVLTK
ncbi:MAG: choice-of-anchor Q domain-containing protein [Bacteroidota bacterium]